MKALLLSQYKRLDIVELDEPVLGPDDVLVEVRACGICGSDIHGYDGSSGRRIPPLVMGHEAAGVVARIGSNVTNLAVSQRVTFDSTVSCGQCFFCLRGDINLCDHRRVLGVSCGEYRQHGAFAEFVAVPQHICYTIPDSLPFAQAAMIEAVSIAVHAARRTLVESGDVAVIVGSGMIGLLVIQAMRQAGCSTVIAVDLDPHRLELARELGADHTLQADEVEVADEVRQLTGGRGADIALEVVGAGGTIAMAIDSVRKGGRVTLVGNLAPKVEMPLQSVVTRELSLIGSCASRGEYPDCIEMISRGDILVEPLISAMAPLEEGPEWFERLYAGQPGMLKVMLLPNG